MALKKELVGSGVWGGTADAVNGSVATGLTSAGTAYTDCLRLTAAVNVLGTVGASSGVGLPNGATTGDHVYVRNGGASALAVYPPVGGTINGGSANAAVSLATTSITTRAALFICVSADGLTWVSLDRKSVV